MPAPRGVAVVLASLLVSVAALSGAAMPGCAAAAVTWPPSRGLLISELITGGASASDEFIEIYNAAAGPSDLGGDELVYVTASGSTTTRKAAFSAPLMLSPGQHLLLANSAGIYAAQADAAYSGGLAADGGTLALRTPGGTVIDAVGWGTASNGFVEGRVAPAPPARSSLERLPGGLAGNATDTNDNASDWFVQPNPTPESLAAAPRPQPTAPATATPSLASFFEPTAEPTAQRTAQATAGPTIEPTAQPTPLPTAEPTAGPTVPPTAEPTGDRTASPTAEPTATAVPTAEPTQATAAPTSSDVPGRAIATARQQAVGTRVRVEGVITASPGLVGDGYLLAIADASAGIFVRLAPLPEGLSIGRTVAVTGSLSAPYGQIEIREITSFVAGAAAADPEPAPAQVADVGERLEGSLVTVVGTVDSVTVDGARLVIALVDGKNELRALADPAAGISKSDVVRGERVALTGVVGQRATGLGRLDGYRLWLRRRADLVAAPPSPSASPLPTFAATPKPSRTPRPSPTPVPVYHDLATGLAVRGRSVDVEATVTAAAGIIDWGGPTIVVDDGTAAVAVVLPAGAASPRIGARVRVAGKVGSLHSGVRVVATSIVALGDGVVPPPLQITGALGSGLEWRLVQACGHIERLTRAGSRWRVDLSVGGKTVAVLGEPAAGIPATGLLVGRLALVNGIVRRSTSDSSEFVLLPRSRQDLWLGPAPAPSAAHAEQAAISAVSSPLSSGSDAAGSTAPLVAVAELAGYEGSTVSVAGIVAAAAGRQATLEDGTGSVRLGGESAADALALLEPGDAIEVTGAVTHDAAGLVMFVDPERIVTLAGPGLEAAASANDGSVAASGSVAPGSAPAADVTGTSPRRNADGMARPSAASVDRDGLLIAAIAAAMVMLLAVWLLATRLAGRFPLLPQRALRSSIRRRERP
jgi:hypothetical protein